ncbi:MAG: response regulator transcription factor [Bacteroidales bacterium]
MNMKANVLLVEDDANLGYVVKDYLRLSGYNTELRNNGVEGLEAFQQGVFDLCILDIMMPLKDGFTLAEEIRRKDSMVPIIFITAKSLDEDKIRGFKAGADDYITKPFSTEELRLRIEAILKRSRIGNTGMENSFIFEIGDYTFDYSGYLLSWPKGDKRLTKKEAEVLRLLCLNKNRILRRDVALKAIWGEDDYFMGRSMDVYITKLRKLLSHDPRVSIINIHRIGFKLEVPE